MPYGLIPLVASVVLTGLYLFTDAVSWSNVVVVGLLMISLAGCIGYLPFPLFASNNAGGGDSFPACLTIMNHAENCL